MINSELSRPLSHLKTLPLAAALTIASHVCHAADSVKAVLGADLEQSFVAAILAPMSDLVQSPYVDPTVLENPLGLTTTSTISRQVMRTVMAESQGVLASHTIHGLTPVLEGTPQKMAVTPFEFTENSIEASAVLHFRSEEPGLPASLAMMAR